MKQTLISNKRKAVNGQKKFILLDTEDKTFIERWTGATEVNYKSADLTIEVSSINKAKEELFNKGYVQK